MWEALVGPALKDHMRSGALTPMSSITRARAIFAALTNRRRAYVTSTSSVMTLRDESFDCRKASLKAWKAVASDMA